MKAAWSHKIHLVPSLWYYTSLAKPIGELSLTQSKSTENEMLCNLPISGEQWWYK